MHIKPSQPSSSSSYPYANPSSPIELDEVYLSRAYATIDELNFSEDSKTEMKALCHRHITTTQTQTQNHIVMHMLCFYSNDSSQPININIKDLPDDYRPDEIFAYCDCCNTYLRERSIGQHKTGKGHNKEKKHSEFSYFLKGVFNNTEARSFFNRHKKYDYRRKTDKWIKSIIEELNKRKIMAYHNLPPIHNDQTPTYVAQSFYNPSNVPPFGWARPPSTASSYAVPTLKYLPPQAPQTFPLTPQTFPLTPQTFPLTPQTFPLTPQTFPLTPQARHSTDLVHLPSSESVRWGQAEPPRTLLSTPVTPSYHLAPHAHPQDYPEYSGETHTPPSYSGNFSTFQDASYDLGIQPAHDPQKKTDRSADY